MRTLIVVALVIAAFSFLLVGCTVGQSAERLEIEIALANAFETIKEARMEDFGKYCVDQMPLDENNVTLLDEQRDYLQAFLGTLTYEILDIKIMGNTATARVFISAVDREHALADMETRRDSIEAKWFDECAAGIQDGSDEAWNDFMNSAYYETLRQTVQRNEMELTVNLEKVGDRWLIHADKDFHESHAIIGL